MSPLFRGRRQLRLCSGVQLLKKRIEYLEMQNKELAREAVELNRAGKKQRALACLKRKKMREKQIDNNDNMLQNIITQRTALENAAFNAEHVTAQKQAIIGLRQATKEVTPERIDELNDEMQELMDGVNEVQDALAHQARPCPALTTTIRALVSLGQCPRFRAAFRATSPPQRALLSTGRLLPLSSLRPTDSAPSALPPAGRGGRPR